MMSSRIDLFDFILFNILAQDMIDNAISHGF